MKRTFWFLLVMTSLVTLVASACGSPAAPAQQAPAAPVQQQPAQPAQQQPAQPAAQGAPAQAFAPACQAAASCKAPDLKDTEPTNTFCVQKIPYQNISVDPGTKFEVIDPKGELKCQDSGTVVKGKEIITCTGKQLWTYQLKLTSGACTGGALATGTGKCQEGQGYDSAQNCCAPLTTGDAGGSVTIKVNIGACPLPQGISTKTK
jgi:hypothetical protein